MLSVLPWWGFRLVVGILGNIQCTCRLLRRLEIWYLEIESRFGEILMLFHYNLKSFWGGNANLEIPQSKHISEKKSPAVNRHWRVRYRLLLWVAGLLHLRMTDMTSDLSAAGKAGFDKDYAVSLDDKDPLCHFSNEFIIPSREDLTRKTIVAPEPGEPLPSNHLTRP